MSFAALGEATGAAGVNIQGSAGLGRASQCDPSPVRRRRCAAPRRGAEDLRPGVADEREVLVIDAEDRPGTLGDLARAPATPATELAYTPLADHALRGR